MQLFRECTTEEIIDLLGCEQQVELPKLKEEKSHTLADLEQIAINYLYEKIENKRNLLTEDVELLKILVKLSYGEYKTNNNMSEVAKEIREVLKEINKISY